MTDEVESWCEHYTPLGECPICSPSNEEPLRIWWNKNLAHKISPGKLAAHAAHAALKAYGIQYTHPIVVLGAGKSRIEAMPITIHDAGHTELEPGTLTTGVEDTTHKSWLEQHDADQMSLDANSYHSRLIEAQKHTGALEQEVASLKEQLATQITEEDRPLWRRITNQRRALRTEILWRNIYYKRYLSMRKERDAAVETIEKIELEIAATDLDSNEALQADLAERIRAITRTPEGQNGDPA